MAAVGWLWLLPGAAPAHPVYIALPEETVSDHLKAATAVVLARPSPENPFRYLPATWLTGGNLTGLPPIPHLVDSGTRHRLARNAEDAVVFVHRADETAWQRIGYANAAVRRMLDALISTVPDWTGGRDDPDRFTFFAERHGHPDPTVRRIAVIEMSQAPYRLIRSMTPALDRAELEALLRDPTQAPLAPLYVLMLGLVADPEAHALVRSMVARAQRLGMGSELLAWTTALIEIDGPAAVDRLASMVLGPTPVARETAEIVVAALGLHGTEGRIALRPSIARVLHEITSRDPALAAQAVHHLTVWEDWSAVSAAMAHLRGDAPLGLQERFALTAYVAGAQRTSSPAAGD